MGYNKNTIKNDDYSSFNKETLFFIFYYMQHTKAQIRSANELKKQKWIFHTKFHVWFYRNGNQEKILQKTKSKNNTFEIGDYIIFDVDEWQCRLKRNFKFEYKYMDIASNNRLIYDPLNINNQNRDSHSSLTNSNENYINSNNDQNDT